MSTEIPRLDACLLAFAAQKMNAIQQWAVVKDYLDIHRLLSEGVTLEMALGAAVILYPNFNPIIPLKALSYFGDTPGVPQHIQCDLRNAASRVRDICRIEGPALSALKNLDSTADTSGIEDLS